MKNWLFKNRGKLTAAVFIILLLLAAWFYGDGSGNKSKSSAPKTVAENAGRTDDKNTAPDNNQGADGNTPGAKGSVDNQGADGNTPGANDSGNNQGADGNTPGAKGSGDNQGADGNTPGAKGSDDNQNSEGKNPEGSTSEKGGHGSGSGSGLTDQKVDPQEAPGKNNPGTQNGTTPTQAVNGEGNTNISTPAVSATPTPSDTPAAWDHRCTICIDCKTILPHLSELNPRLSSLIPSNGVILAETEVGFSEGDTVFDVLKRVCSEKNICLDYSKVPAFQTVYIKGLADLYEFDVGDLSGWQYFLNDEYVPVGCSACILSEGDRISWLYTCDLGRDL